MLILKTISLLQFKNYRSQAFHFNERIVGICGNNGLGKTNLLDAIYILCFTKSYFSKSDNAVVLNGAQGMRIEGNFLKNGEAEKVVCILRENNKKEIKLNGEDYKRFSEHIGKFTAVVVAPDDVELITGTSEVRRKFVDTLLSQANSDYLKNLIEYSRVLQQRNSFLKASAEKNYTDSDLLDILDDQLAKAGKAIFKYRKEFLEVFLPKVAERYLQIAGTNEPVWLNYYSPLFEEDFSALLATFRKRDLMLQRTTIGIHKDDLELKLGEEQFKHIASQGQRKSLLFSLKFKEYEELSELKGFPPLLLLDDVFEKLDEGRIHNMLRYVCVGNAGQVFITDTHKERLQAALQKLSVDYQVIEL